MSHCIEPRTTRSSQVFARNITKICCSICLSMFLIYIVFLSMHMSILSIPNSCVDSMMHIKKEQTKHWGIHTIAVHANDYGIHLYIIIHSYNVAFMQIMRDLLRFIQLSKYKNPIPSFGATPWLNRQPFRAEMTLGYSWTPDPIAESRQERTTWAQEGRSPAGSRDHAFDAFQLAVDTARPPLSSCHPLSSFGREHNKSTKQISLLTLALQLADWKKNVAERAGFMFRVNQPAVEAMWCDEFLKFDMHTNQAKLDQTICTCIEVYW